MQIKNILLLVTVCIFLTSCKRTGYVKKDGKWTYQFYAGGDFEVSNVIVAGIDEATFESIDSQYGKDKSSVFFKDFKILGADPSSFKVIYKTMAKDKNHVYADSVLVNNVDTKSYKHLEEEFFKDKNAVFIHGTPIPLMDVKTFEIIKYPYFKDKNHIYCGTVPLLVKDKASFKVTNSGGGRYYEDTEAFTGLSPEYKWMNDTKTYYPVFYVHDATAKTNTENFEGYKLVK